MKNKRLIKAMKVLRAKRSAYDSVYYSAPWSAYSSSWSSCWSVYDSAKLDKPKVLEIIKGKLK